MKAVGFSRNSSRISGCFCRYSCRVGWFSTHSSLLISEGSLRSCSAISGWLSRNRSMPASSRQVVSLSSGFWAVTVCPLTGVPIQNNIAKASSGANEARAYRRLVLLVAISTKPPVMSMWLTGGEVQPLCQTDSVRRHLGQTQRLAKTGWEFQDFRCMKFLHSGGKFAVQDRPWNNLSEQVRGE